MHTEKENEFDTVYAITRKQNGTITVELEFPDFPPVPLSIPELLKLTITMKLKCITLPDDKDANFHLDRKKSYFPTHIAGRHVP